MNTIAAGFRVGHWTDAEALTGCTVILCPEGTKGSCEVRGSSPGSRELALLAPEKSMQEVHALLLTGGSAFGLRAADGVMDWLRARGMGYATPWGKVPIVPAAVVFDLNLGRNDVWPDEQSGKAACEAAVGECGGGLIGAGTGTSVGKWNGIERAMRGGLGCVSAKEGELELTSLAVVNAVGDVVDAGGAVLAGARASDGTFLASSDPRRTLARGKVLESTNTTLAVVMTNARLSKLDLFKVAQRMHDGMARAIIPVHTNFDGDATFALSAGTVDVGFDWIAETAAALTADAIRAAVRTGERQRRAAAGERET